MFASSYICDQVFLTMNLRNNYLRSRVTDEQLASFLRISTSHFDPQYKKLLKMKGQFHSSH
ncbi:hypothetical protein X975_22819, partial [Stegodyphus mimosarum]